MEEVYKLIYIWVLGFVIKFYDDLEDLFISKNERLVETTKTLMMALTCYYLFVMAETQYEIYWISYIVSLCFMDWYAYAGSDYFFSANVVVICMCVYLFISKGYTFHLGYFILSYLLYSLCIPCVETFCCEINGPIHDMLKYWKIVPQEKTFIFNKSLSKTDMEVSFYKVKTRIASVVHLTIAGIILYLVRSRFQFSQNINQILTSGIYLCSVFNGYFLCSVLVQIYAVFFDNNRIIDMHNDLNTKSSLQDSLAPKFSASEACTELSCCRHSAR